MIEKRTSKNPRKNLSSFLGLCELYVDRLYAYILSRVDSEDRARELVEETILKALERADTCYSGGSLAGWLFQVASLYLTPMERGEKSADKSRLECFPDLWYGSLAGLSENEREILRLHLIARLPLEEIAGLLRCEIEVVRGLLDGVSERMKAGKETLGDPLRELREYFSSIAFPPSCRAELKGRLEEKICLLKKRSSLIYRLRILLLPLFSVGFLLLIFFGIRSFFPVEPALPALNTVTLRQPTPGEILPINPSLSTDTPTTIPLEVMVYRTAAGAKLTDAERLCDLLGVFRSIRLTEDTFVAGFYGELLIWQDSGSFLYEPRPSLEADHSLAGPEALAKAQQFLEERNLWPADVAGSSLTAGLSPELVTVQFYRAFNGLSVDGSRIEVSYQGEELIRLYYNWRPALPFRHYPVLEIDQAREKLTQNLELSDFSVERVQLVMIEGDPDEHQEFLLPAFIFSGRQLRSGMPYQYKLWALDQQYLSP